MSNRRYTQGFRAGAAWLAVAGMFFLTAACSDSPSQASGDATFQVVVTGSSAQMMLSAFQTDDRIAFDEHGETPMTGENVASAEVTISRVYLVGGDQGQVDLFNDSENPKVIDLMQLVNDPGVEIEFTDPVPVPDGAYGQLRLVVDEVTVELAGDAEFADGSQVKQAMLPSGFLRINLHDDLQFEGDETVVLLADFEMTRSFAFQGPPSAPMGVILKPVLFQEIDRNDG